MFFYCLNEWEKGVWICKIFFSLKLYIFLQIFLIHLLTAESMWWNSWDCCQKVSNVLEPAVYGSGSARFPVWIQITKYADVPTFTYNYHDSSQLISRSCCTWCFGLTQGLDDNKVSDTNQNSKCYHQNLSWGFGPVCYWIFLYHSLIYSLVPWQILQSHHWQRTSCALQ